MTTRQIIDAIAFAFFIALPFVFYFWNMTP
jgi:hypothetical protein